jgi:UDP-glucose 4-epimerase
VTYRVMVTGATGYIGSHVCKHLKAQGYEVVGIDLVEREHTLKFMDEFINDDFNSVDCFAALKKTHAVVHCAGTSLVGPSMLDPAEYYVNNVAKTANFLDVLRHMGTPPVFVFSSSAAVYGNPDVDVIHENAPWLPLSPYGQSKAMIEIMVADISRAYHINCMNLRYFNACGADVDAGELGQAPGATHIIARLLESVRDKKDFTLYGTNYPTPDGTCIRDYVHVDDLARAHCLAIQYLLSDVGNSCSINLGSGHGYSNREIIAAVEQHVAPVRVIETDPRPGDPAKLVASNSLAKAYLGWTPEHNLETIIKSAWKWYNNQPKLIDTEV